MADDKNKIEIRSSEVQEILGSVPSRIVRFGMYIFLFVLALIIAGAFIFKYPERIISKIVVTTENPPVTIKARYTGKIEKLFVADNQKVKAGQVLALIQNYSNYEDVLKLEAIIDSVQPAFDTLGLVPADIFNKNLQLGTVQEYYSQFLTRYNELLVFMQQQYYPQMNKSLKEQLQMAKIQYDRLWQQKNTVDEEYQIRLHNYKRQQRLIAQGAISSLEFEKVKSEMLSKKSELQSINSLLAQKEMDKNGLQQEIFQNEKTYSDQKNKYWSEMMQAFNILKSEVRNWDLTFLMRSPINGTITFTKIYSENQNVVEGDKVFNIVPEDMGELVGKVELPIRGSGKVKPGQDVNVKFDNYPYIQYGLVRGKVKNVSKVPEDDFYMVEVTFPNGLVTNYNKPLEFQNNLMGQAEIITDNLRLIQRIFNPLKALWKERIAD